MVFPIRSKRDQRDEDFSFRWRGAMIVAIPTACMLVSLLVIAWLRDNSWAARSRLDQSQTILEKTDDLLISLLNAETGIRGYSLTLQPEFLKPYTKARQTLPQDLDSLDRLVKTPSQREQLKKIQSLSQQEIKLLGRTLEAIGSTSTNAIAKTQTSDQLNPLLVQGKSKMDALRQEIEVFSAEENRLQDQLQQKVSSWRDLTTTVQWTSFFAGLLGTGAAIYLFDQLDRELVKRANRLRDSNIRTEAILDNVVDGIVTLNERGYIESFNAAATEIFGYEMDEAIALHFQRLSAKPLSENSGDIMKLLVGDNQNKLKRQQETIGCRKDGSTFPLEFAISRMYLQNQRLYIAILRDISQRQESEELYRTLAKNFPNGVVLLFDFDLRYTLAEGKEFLGLEFDTHSAIGKTLREVFPNETSDLLEPVHREALVGQATVLEMPLNDRIYQVYVLPVQNEQGEVFAGMMMTQDITESKQFMEVLQTRADELARLTSILAQTTTNLEKRNRELDQFAYIVSHDLKAPLRAIANLSSWIEEDIQDQLTEETQEQMNLLRGRVHRMEALINGLLQYSRVGRFPNQVERVDVGALLAEAIDSISPPPEFTVTIQPEMPTLYTERIPLEQVFANLIGNAIKHHPQRDGKVEISVQDRGRTYEFAVADNGSGIAPEFHDKVFVIFQTLEARDKVENTGVGLAIVKKIIEDQGGAIALESQLGKGATFRFTWQKQSKAKKS